MQNINAESKDEILRPHFGALVHSKPKCVDLDKVFTSKIMNRFLTDSIINAALFIIGIIVLIRLRNYFRAVLLALTLPGPTAYPLIGNALTVTNSEKLNYLGKNLYRLYGPIVRTWVSLVPFFFILDPTHLQIILSNGRLTKKNMLYTLLHNFIGEGLITNNGGKWKLHRKLIQPYFHINVLENFVSVFVETSDVLVKNLSKVDVVNVTSYINNWVLDTLHRGVLGIPMTDEDFRNSPFRKGEVLVPYRISRPWMLLDFIFKFTKSSVDEKKQRTNLHEFTKKVLDSRRERGPTPSANFISLLDMFITIADSEPKFTDQDIINEICTFMLAGQDSVGAATAFAYIFLQNMRTFKQKYTKSKLKYSKKIQEKLL
ncbi:hypothetical protein WA026_018439 [Henosepilachna vigintioctopunctata]|uniref:Cytochrome P450 n=1 Tax=Henosepilachna vigintioctopunctata TaxID=420089 RepID=A0AAW1V3C1_9CUCU